MARGIEIRDAHFPGRAPVDAYGNGGFRFADMSHRGSLLCLPSGIHGWEPVPAIDRDTLAPVFAEAEAIDVLIVGTGVGLVLLEPELTQALREAGIVAEAMSTGAAVRTYNVLLAENRAVAAALVAVD
ncbi:MAG: hypothetical protein KDJ88_11945 [Bauldia sp.]|nr:hypothetical protein [Bauldia sp.]